MALSGTARSSPRQGIFWILTIPQADFTPYLPPLARFIRGQLEKASSGFLHWQLVVGFTRKQSLPSLKRCFGNSCHAELTRSAAAIDYVWKEDTRVDGTQFELGTLPVAKCPTDWAAVRAAAVRGDLDSPDIPADVYVRCYNALSRIRSDHLQPTAMVRTVLVFWGATGTGKSRAAWDAAGLDAYPKDALSKFWCGYRNQEHVVIDEFRGVVNISHVLRWFDRYPVIVEIKGGAVPLRATKIWITSNLHPKDWYPELDASTTAALLRRLVVTEYLAPLQ